MSMNMNMSTPEVERWLAGVQPIIGRLQALPEQAARIALAVRDRVNQIEVDSTLSVRGKREAEESARKQGLQQLDDLARSAREDVDALQAAIDRALATEPPDPQTALLQEIRRLRAWQRCARLLDAQTDASAATRQLEQLIQEAGTRGDLTTLDAIAEEAPAYLQARHIYYDLQKRLDQARAPLLPPVGRAALQLAQQAWEGWPRVSAAVELARQYVRGDLRTLAALPGWSANEQLNINY